LARRRRKIDTERRSVESVARLIGVGAHIRKQIRATLTNASLCFISAKARAQGDGALSRGQAGGIAE
jgi:hypothetical protein